MTQTGARTDVEPDAIRQRRRHAFVLLNYRARVAGYLFAVAIVASAVWHERRPVLFWVPFVAVMIVWPHLAYALVRRAENARRAELRNEVIDVAAAGVLSALLSFSLWPIVAFTVPTLITVLRAGGLRLYLIAAGAGAAATLLTALVTGFRVEPGASGLTTGLSIVFLFAFVMNFALTTRMQGRTLRQRSVALGEALERQTATSEILRTIGGVHTDVGPVFEAIVRNAVTLCGGRMGAAFRFDGERLHLVAHHNYSPQAIAVSAGAFPMVPTRASLTARAIIDRDVVHVPDVERDPDFRMHEVARTIGYRSVLAAPMMRDGAPIGVIAVGRPEAGAFSEAQIDLLKSFADQAAIAVSNAALFEAVQARTEELARALDETRALGEVTQAVSSSLDLHDVLHTVIRHAVTLSQGDAGAIFQFEPARQAFVALASHNLSQAMLDRIATTPVDPTVGGVGRAMQTGQPWEIPDMEAAHRYQFRELTLADGYRSMLAVPIPADVVTRGIVVYRRRAGRFDDRVGQLLVALANQSKVAIDNAALFQKAQALSANLQQLYELSTAMQEPLSLAEQLRRVLEGAIRIGLIDRIYVWVVSPRADRLMTLAGAGFSEAEYEDFKGASIPLDEAGAMAKAFREGQPLLYNRDHPLPPELRLRRPWSDLKGVRSRDFVIIPMIARGETVGLFTGDNKPSGRPIAPDVVGILRTFASHAAVAVANARQFEELRTKSEELAIASQHKSQFLANMSHELRTPLNAILGFVEMMLDDIYGDVPENLRPPLTDVQTNGRHLLRLINDVLDLSKIEAGRMELSVGEYSVQDVVDTVRASLASLASEKGLEFTASASPDLPFAVGDGKRLTQCLMNLAGNAIKFTRQGRVDIAVTLDGGSFCYRVSDTGVGIPADQLATIFETFRQVDATIAREFGGTGLGLSISRRFCRLMGGDIAVESTPGKGSTFTMRLPAHFDPAAAAATNLPAVEKR